MTSQPGNGTCHVVCTTVRNERDGYWWRSTGGLVITDLRTPEEMAHDRRRRDERAMDMMMCEAHWRIDMDQLGYPRPLPRP